MKFFVPYSDRIQGGKDGKLQTKFSDTFINKIKRAHGQILAHLEKTRNDHNYTFIVSHMPEPKPGLDDKLKSKWHTKVGINHILRN